jgi:hypothetical protein
VRREILAKKTLSVSLRPESRSFEVDSWFPAADQTNGYVPNVVYTCGALIHGGRLILPYGLNDTVTKIVTIELETLLAALIN